MKQAIKKVLVKIKENNYQAYVVGGYPRDFYLRRKSIDVDVCTSAKPKELKAIFPKSDVTKAKYGVVNFYFNQVHFEITTFRREIKYDNKRRPIEIEYIDDVVEDLKRRDFTINTLCMDENEQIFDFLNIMSDLDAKIIKTVGDPAKKLSEDPLRILRAIRFATTLDFQIAEKLYQNIAKKGELIELISFQRKREELDKIFASSNCKKGFQLLEETNLAHYLQLGNVNNVKIVNDLMGIWGQLDVLDIYPFNRQEKKTIMKIKELLKYDQITDYLIYRYGVYISSIVGEIKGISKNEIHQRYQKLPIKNKEDIKIEPQELQFYTKEKCGVKKIYWELEQKIIEKALKNERSEIIGYLNQKSF